MARIFISYSRKDIGFVRKLAGDLETAGYDVWWDISDLRGGDDWVRLIPDAIASSDFFIVVLTPNAIASEWVRREYTQALSLRKRVIPIMLARAPMPFALNTINYVDFTSGDYADNLNALLTALGYSGELPVTPTTFPFMLRRYAVPILIGVLILLALISSFIFKPLAPSTMTPSILPPTTPAVTFTTEPDTPTVIPTASSTVTSTPSRTLTPTSSPTLTPSLTKQPFDLLLYCVNSLYANTINVRSGPGTTHPPIGEPLPVGKCLNFSARNEEATWLQIAPVQSDSTLEQYIDGWIFRELLGLGDTGPIDLPAVTLTLTPTPSDTPTVTPTFTRTPTDAPTLTPTDTLTPTHTDTPTATDTPTP